MNSQIIKVNPSLAEEWLKTNTFNRLVSKGSVERYARDMASGNWRLNHQGIAFDSEGVLVDGQHRLFAVIKSGVTVEMMVTFGADRVGIDELRVRKTSDVIKFGKLSEWIDRRQVEIAKQMIGLCTEKSSKAEAFSTSDIVIFAEKNKDAIMFSHALFTSNVKGISTAAARAVIATASYHYEKNDLKEFVDTLYSGISTSPDRSAAIKCRDLMLQGGFSGGHSCRMAMAYKMMRAVKAFCERQPLKSLMPQSAPAFLVPKERS